MSFDPSSDPLSTELLRNNKPMPIPNVGNLHETWFMEEINEEGMATGNVTAMSEVDAWNALQPNQLNRGYKPKYRIIGVSIPYAYDKAVKEMATIHDPDPEKQKVMRQDRLRQGFQEAVEEARGKNIKRPRNPNLRGFNGDYLSDEMKKEAGGLIRR